MSLSKYVQSQKCDWILGFGHKNRIKYSIHFFSTEKQQASSSRTFHSFLQQQIQAFKSIMIDTKSDYVMLGLG